MHELQCQDTYPLCNALLYIGPESKAIIIKFTVSLCESDACLTSQLQRTPLYYSLWSLPSENIELHEPSAPVLS
jgi:hypothetical protein